VLHVWEDEPPPEVPEPVDWVLLTSVPTTSAAAVWERVGWYQCRWTNEDYHQCLKTGCAIEQRHLGDQPALERLLALCAPVAIELLRLRDLARCDPAQPAAAVVAPDLLQVVAAVTDEPLEGMTVQRFWLAVARHGGYLDRKHDGPPGWKALWHGWQDLARILTGVRLAQTLPLPP
jgi:hypothetical protein